MKRLMFILMGAALLLWGCGYHVPGAHRGLLEGVETLQVEFFTNLTSEPYLDNRISNAVMDRFIRTEGLELVEDPKKADAVLSGRIVQYKTTAFGYDQTDEISEYRSSMAVDAALTRTLDGQVLWKGQVAWNAEYASNDDKVRQDDLEKEAIEEISERLADELYYRILDQF